MSRSWSSLPGLAVTRDRQCPIVAALSAECGRHCCLPSQECSSTFLAKSRFYSFGKRSSQPCARGAYKPSWTAGWEGQPPGGPWFFPKKQEVCEQKGLPPSSPLKTVVRGHVTVFLLVGPPEDADRVVEEAPLSC